MESWLPGSHHSATLLCHSWAEVEVEAPKEDLKNVFIALKITQGTMEKWEEQYNQLEQFLSTSKSTYCEKIFNCNI